LPPLVSRSRRGSWPPGERIKRNQPGTAGIDLKLRKSSNGGAFRAKMARKPRQCSIHEKLPG
jgi:hypothetical protein